MSRLKKGLWYLSKLAFRVFIAFTAFTLLWVGISKFVNPPVTVLMLIRSFETEKESPISKDWISLAEMGHDMGLAVVAAEDQKFSEHYGFDLDAIASAFENNQSTNRKNLKGGSTISQQTAKNVFLWPQRSWLRKGLEVWFTFWIETIWGKDRILEVYLNVVEMGDGIYGMEAASHAYFNKPISKASREEKAQISCMSA